MRAADQIRVELIEERARIPLGRDEWNALAARNETNTIFQTFEWFDAWWSVFGSDCQLFFLHVKKGDATVGFAPFMLRKERGLTQLEFVGTGNADYQDVVLSGDKPAGLKAVCAFLQAHAARWGRAWFANVPAPSSTLPLLASFGASQGLYLVEETRMKCPALQLAGREPEVARLINKYSVRRPLNWFSRQGKLAFRRITAPEEIERKLAQLFDQHVRRWEAAGKGSLFRDERQRAFYAALAQRLGATDWLLLSSVELDGESIALHYGFDYEGTVTWYKPSFESRYAEHSPGLLLIQQLIEDALKRSRRQIDFTIGDEPFKQRFANCERSNVFLGVYHSRSAYAAALLVRSARRWAGRFLRRVRRWNAPPSEST